MRFRRRRRGRRKATPIQTAMQLFYSVALLINLIAIGTLAVSASPSPANSTDFTGTTRQLYKRQSAAADSQFSATPQVTFSNEDHDLEQQQQQQQQNHYEEPLALATSSEDASQDSQQTRQNKGKRTLYACEEKQLEIDCQLGESIQLIRANYGRFSIQICNEHGQLDWKVNCMSSDSYDIIARSCQAKQSCQLLASNEIFGDACPGTQKYLEVHYQCVPANRTQPSDQQQSQQKVNSMKPVTSSTIKTGNNVIQQQQFGAGGDAAITASNSEISGLQQQQQIVTRPPWMGPVTPLSSPKQLPNWITNVSLNPYHVGGGRLAPGPISTQTPESTAPESSSSPSSGAVAPQRAGHCPEMVWRSIRWPETEAGQLAQRPCPAHTFPSASSLATGLAQTGAASLFCQPNGQWAERTHIPGRCHSYWLRNLTQRLDTGDSPLSILSELVYRTQLMPVVMSAGGQETAKSNHHQQPVGGSSGVAPWLAHATSSLTSSQSSAAGGQPGARPSRFSLFGEDLVQMARIVGRLVDEMGELLARINDDKQRITFAREMIQLIVDLTSNLLNEEHSEAWLDLASSQPAGSGQSGERQRVAGQLLSGLENGCVLLAGARQHQPQRSSSAEAAPLIGNQEDFQKITDRVYVAIQSFVLDLKQPGHSQRLQVTFPSQASLLGTRWMNSDQRFTLNLQASNLAEAEQQQAGQASNAGGQQQQLKIVSVMVRGLGAHMEPTMIQQQQLAQESSDKSSPGDSLQTGSTLAVNSDLVGFSIVADSARTPTKVDLSAPIELVFRHNNLAIVNGGEGAASLGRQPPTTSTASRQAGHCVYWDTTTSDWSTGGCKLMASNRTHSVCACDHLTTFGLLNELDHMIGQQLTQTQTAATTTSGPGGQHIGQSGRPTRVHLDNVESELAFDGQTMKAIFMAKILECGLFSSQTGTRSVLYASCCLSALLLVLLLAASAYNRAHARRLLGSLPAEPPPSLLVANYHNQQQQLGTLHATGPNSIETSTTNGTSPPTSYSSGGPAANVDLLAAGLKHEPANILSHDDELNGFYSLIGTGVHQLVNQCASGAINSLAKHHQDGSSQVRTAANSLAIHQHRKDKQSFVELALVPVHLIVQLLLLQLLLLLLVESRNLLVWNSHQAKRHSMQTSLALLSFSQFSTGLSTGPLDQQQQPNQLDPIGLITWLVVFSLYYLVSTLLFWLLARLIQLNGHLIELNEMLAPPPAGAKHYQPIQAISGATIYQQQQQPMNRYGQCQIHQNGATQQASSSPSLSNISSSIAADINSQQQLGGRLEHLESRQFNKEQSIYMRQSLVRSARQLQQRAGRVDESGCSLSHCLARASTSDQLAGLLVHLGPVLMSCLLVWLTYERAQFINLVAYTSSWASQLAYWPLVLNAGWMFPLALNLYCLPSISLALGILALAMLRRQFNRIYKSQTLVGGPFGALTKQPNGHHHRESESALMVDAKSQQQRRRQLQASGGSSGQLAIELAVETRRAKFACLTLLALLALNSICWISFFIHCHQALNQPGAEQQQSSTTDGNLILTFASSNLLITLLICCSQRKQLKRACQLLGLTRFVALASGRCCQLGEATKSSPASTSSVSSSSYYNNNNGGGNVHHIDHQQQQQQQQKQSLHYGTGKSIKISSAASQQSLFVISRSRPVGGGTAGGMFAEIAQPTYGGHQTYGSGPQHHIQQNNNYPMPMANQQHHLYQQLATASSQQHIYDSTTNLSNTAEMAEQQRQRQLNAFHLMAQQQQQQQFNQHEPMIHYTLGRPFNGSQFHLNQQQQQGQQQYGAGNMTLKPMPSSVQQQQMSFAPHQQQGDRNNQHESLMCPISGAGPAATKTHSASSSGRQQQFQAPAQGQQQLSASSSAGSSSGEADGPLVALAQTTTPTLLNKRRHEFSIATANQSMSPATFGPMHYNNGMTTNSNNNNNNSQQATEHRQSSNSSSSNNNNDNQSFVEVIGHGGGSGVGVNHCIGSGLQVAATGKPIKHNDCDQADQQHHNKQPPASSQNYTDALKAAMAQEANQQHFRRTNSTAMRQQQSQQQQQPHRSFASSSSGGGSAMIDAQLDYQSRPSRFGVGLGDMLTAANAHHESNIYDVANCGPVVGR